MPSPQGRLRVLAVDDDLEILEVYRTLLQGAPVAFRQAHDPVAALRLLTEERFDVVVTDLMMPSLGGGEIVRLVRTSAANRNARLAVVSGHVDHETETELRALGVDHVLLKPFQRKDVLSIFAGTDSRSEGAERTPPSYRPEVLQVVRDAVETVIGSSLPLLRFGSFEERRSPDSRGDVTSVVALFGDKAWGEIHLLGDLAFFRAVHRGLAGDRKAVPTIEQMSDLANELCNQIGAEILRGVSRLDTSLSMRMGLPFATGALATTPRLTTGRLASTFLASRTVQGGHGWIEFAFCGLLGADGLS